MKILITGSLGFIATNLILRLSQDTSLDLVGVDNGSSQSLNSKYTSNLHMHNPVDLDCQDQLIHLLNGVDLVIHLAARGNVVESISNPLVNFHSNVFSTISLLEAMRSNGVTKIIFASTGGALMGNTQPPVNENSLPAPISPYGASKASCESYLSAYTHSFGFDAISLRFGNVYGPYSSHKNGVINKWLRSAIKCENIHIFGDGSSTRDYIHVDDLIDGICLAVDSLYSSSSPAFTKYHLANSHEVSLNYLVDVINSVSAKPLNVQYMPSRLGEVSRNFAETSLARNTLGFNPSTDLNEGIARLYKWILENEFKSTL